jgi:hypothetical protein
MTPNLAAEYDQRANLHRPQTPERMAAAVRQLLAQGLTRRDVADALRMSVAEVVGLEKFPE